MQATATRLNMVFSISGCDRLPCIYASWLWPRFDGPTRPNYTILRIHTIAEEEGKIRSKIIDVHSTAQVIFYVGEPISQCNASWVIGFAPASAI
jgi:hypothetical protein